MSGNLANKDAAIQCREKADALFKRGAYQQALKFYDKSLRLYELPGVKSRRDSAYICAQTRSASKKPSADGSSTNGASTGAAPGATGPRRRATASSSTSSASQRASAPAPSSGNSTRPYTAAQKEMADRILKCKDHYSVLGLARGADANAIRKAYKKLALKLHPDKNAAPSAAGAFQKVGTAYACLSDEDARAHYDRYGDEQPQVAQHAHHRQYRGGEPTAEDIFNMMFGGGGVRVHHFGGRGFRRQSTQEEGGERSSFAQILQIVPLLILFALTMFSFGDSREAMFSLDETREYRVKRHTSHPAVIEGLPYFVKPTFGQRAGRDLYKVESSVEQYMYTKLRRECTQARQKQRQYHSLAKRSSGQRAQSFLEQAKHVKMHACDDLNKFKGRYFF